MVAQYKSELLLFAETELGLAEVILEHELPTLSESYTL